MELWPYRLAVRTPGSHPGNPGSIPGGVTKNILAEFSVFFIWYQIYDYKNSTEARSNLGFVTVHLLNDFYQIPRRNVGFNQVTIDAPHHRLARRLVLLEISHNQHLAIWD